MIETQIYDLHEQRVIHTCGNSLCISPSHLRLGTAQDSEKSKAKRGLLAKGEASKASDISEDVALKIYAQKGKMKPKAVMAKFNVSYDIVHRIWNGETWSHVTGAPKKVIKNEKRSIGLKEKQDAWDRWKKILRVEHDAEFDEPHMLSDRCLMGGYGTVRIRGNFRLLHRISLEVSLGRELEEHEVARHKCKHRNCANPNHLETGTASDNGLDRLRDGTADVGVDHPNCKFSSEEEVLEVRSSTEPTKSIAARFGVSTSTVIAIRKRKTWKKLKIEECIE
jgi:hypothetical protein